MSIFDFKPMVSAIVTGEVHPVVESDETGSGIVNTQITWGDGTVVTAGDGTVETWSA